MAEVKQDMLPDSTQGESPQPGNKSARRSKRKQDDGSKAVKRKKKVSKKKMVGKGKQKSSHGNDTDSDLDLSKERQPLGFYLQDREELISQAFRAIKGSQLDAMVPDILKNVPLVELKRLCLNQLEGMSRKRIKCVIAGTEMQSSSDSDESGPEVGVSGPPQVLTAQVDAGPPGEEREKTKQGESQSKIEISVDSTVHPTQETDATGRGLEESGMKVEEEENIDGVPVEIDEDVKNLPDDMKDGIDMARCHVKESRGAVAEEKKQKAVESNQGNGGGDGDHVDVRGSVERRSDKVSSSHHRSSRRSRGRRSRRRSYRSSSRSGSRGRNSRSLRRSYSSTSSHSRGRSRSWSRSRSRSWSRRRSRSWSRRRSRTRSHSRSRSWSSSRSRSRSTSRSLSPRSPSPPRTPVPPLVEAIQMHYPTPPTPTGSLSSGEIREILELENEEDERKAKEEQAKEEELLCMEVEGGEGSKGEKGTGTHLEKDGEQESSCHGDDDGDRMSNFHAQGNNDNRDTNVLNGKCDPCTSANIPNVKTLVTEEVVKGASVDREMAGKEEERDDSEEDSDSTEDSSEETEEDEEDIDIELLDLGVDLSKAKDQPSQLALARASLRSASPSREVGNANEPDPNEPQLEVLELELRARAIRSLMQKCLRDDER
ncbi:uncharacterized protein [Diadema antillarum]|uniref:uncharacterized protein n=1 Tax=Diadema antillarum TaxID=105358 RepID=UPI003A8868D9